MQVGVEVISVIAEIVALMNLFQESVIEVKEVLPVIHERNDNSLLLVRAISDDRVIDGNSLEVVVVGIVGIEVSLSDVWDVVSSVRFSSQVYLISMYVESIDKVLVESDELLSKTDFINNVGSTLRETYTDWLLHPDHVG